MKLGISVSPMLPAHTMEAVRQEAIFSCCKWDPQIGDTATLANYALLLTPACWAQLSTAAVALYHETLAAEREIAKSPTLIKMLSLPPPLERVLLAERAHAASSPSDQPRVMRFDFHPTTEGWRVSEVNSDVPGGYIEADGFSRLMADQFQGCALTASPVDALAEGFRRRGVVNRLIGLVHATAYTDDRQVMVFLQRRFRSVGLESVLLSPEEIVWAEHSTSCALGSLAGWLRFFPVEWLPNLPGQAWKNYFRHSNALVLNPGWAALSQSKRFPLTWPHLGTPTSTWKAYAPPSIPWRRELGSDWVSKPAFGRVGEGIGLPDVTTAEEWKHINQFAPKHPTHWVAQKKFSAVPCATPTGEAHPCLGLYVIDGLCAGIYGRTARRPLIDHSAQDVAVLLDQRDVAPLTNRLSA